ncbi:MAG: ATP-binding protein, partial [Dehalococcoidia bacterium]|nr:ATP-binding protein [Dehalococcoidia bacterium]
DLALDELIPERLLLDAVVEAVRALAHPPQPEDAALALPPPARRLGRFVTLTGLLEALRPTADGSRPETLAEYQQLPWLVLDDLGAERLTAWGADRLYELLNDRVNEERPLVVTSNLDLNALATRWDAQLGDESGQRLVNRLLEGTVVLRWPTDAPNYRIRTPTGTCP